MSYIRDFVKLIMKIYMKCYLVIRNHVVEEFLMLRKVTVNIMRCLLCVRHRSKALCVSNSFNLVPSLQDR